MTSRDHSAFVILSEAKDLVFSKIPKHGVIRFAQGDSYGFCAKVVTRAAVTIEQDDPTLPTPNVARL
jgi:hypothetical protein